jgi:hypothetical protein
MTITITLADGSSHSFSVKFQPRNWKSWLMHQMPYGTDLQGCTFSREGVNTSSSSPDRDCGLNDEDES